MFWRVFFIFGNVTQWKSIGVSPEVASSSLAVATNSFPAFPAMQSVGLLYIKCHRRIKVNSLGFQPNNAGSIPADGTIKNGFEYRGRACTDQNYLCKYI